MVTEVTVVFFAGAREAAGQSRSSIRAGSTVAEARAFLAAHYGRELEQVLASCALWVNGEPARPEDVLRAGDEVAVVPPVSGGELL